MGTMKRFQRAPTANSKSPSDRSCCSRNPKACRFPSGRAITIFQNARGIWTATAPSESNPMNDGSSGASTGPANRESFSVLAWFMISFSRSPQLSSPDPERLKPAGCGEQLVEWYVSPFANWTAS
jgi:hypothetical protein